MDQVKDIKLASRFRLESLEDIISYSPEDDDTRSSLPTDTKEEYKVREVFIQKENCFMTHQSLPQCCECEKDPLTNKFACRFFEFRKIERNNGFFKAVGFLDPFIDPTAQDLKLWTEYEERLITDRESADYILACIASQFCEMSQQELKISKNESTIAWKRSVQEVREICDVCETSLFNCHMTCKNCGTIVCIDCFEERESGIVRWKPKTKADKRERDSFFWLKCPKSEKHDLLLTQITTGNALLFLNQNIHKVCSCRDISQTCECLLGTKDGLLTRSKKLLKEATDNEQKTEDELRKQMKSRHRKKSPLIRNLGFAELNQIYLNVEHVLTSQGRIVKIVEPSESTECYRLFQNQWEKGKPVIVANATKNLRQYTWSPVYFSQRFGAEKHVMIDCHNGNAINRVAMKYFWDGFSSVKKRLPLDCSEKCVLKLKDWPTSDDFANVMKSHFDDFMNAVPLSEYTSRNGKFNLARYLPEHFSRPDLGPKMYSAYAQNHPSTQGSTNLHLDVSDAVNIMVHVSRPADSHLAPKQYSISSIHEALVAAGADEIDKKNLLSGEKLPGAIWHIFPADKANEIRRILRENSREYKRALGVNDDPIHDQVRFNSLFL